MTRLVRAVWILAIATMLWPRAAASQSTTAAGGSVGAAALRARGLDLGYNLDYEEALTAFRAAIDADPNHPAAYRLVAATMWINALFRQGAVTADDYLGQARSEVARQPIAQGFDTEIGRAHV